MAFKQFLEENSVHDESSVSIKNYMQTVCIFSMVSFGKVQVIFFSIHIRKPCLFTWKTMQITTKKKITCNL